MGIQGYIDEIIIHDSSVDQDTIKLYEQLGLDTSYEKGVLKIISTSVSVIKSFNEELVLKIGRSYCNKLIELGIIKEKHAVTHVVYDNLGTKIFIVVRKPHKDIRIGVLTSGGDAPGMNSAVRAVIRTSLKNDIKVFGIYRGYEGLMRGDIRKLGWKSETEGSGQGGTFLLSARSDKFRTREGRKEAAYHLLIRKISSLIVIGGEGSMKGAMKLKEEYSDLCKELMQEGKITKETIDYCKSNKAYLKELYKLKNMNIASGLKDEDIESDVFVDFHETDSSEEFGHNNDENSKDFEEKLHWKLDVVGIPGTIDNDIVGVDFSLGANTALTRIMEVVQKLNSTMKSHRMIFILECMGRDCGWLTLMAGFAIESDVILLPESKNNNWQEKLIKSVRTAVTNHKKNIFIMLSEGARDCASKPILANEVMDLLSYEGLNSRVLRIGHIQRGGMTCAFDRILGTLSGIEAVNCIIDNPQQPSVIAMADGELKILDMQQVVNQTMLANQLAADNKFDELFALRDKTFRDIYKIYNKYENDIVLRFFDQTQHNREENVGVQREKYEQRMMTSSSSISQSLDQRKGKLLKIAVINDGKCACGMNAVLNSLIQVGLANDCEIVYFLDGYDGLLMKNGRQANLFEFSVNHNDGGAVIGTTVSKTVEIQKVKEKLAEMQVDYLVVIGSTRSLQFIDQIPNLILIPTATENNCPGTQSSIGSDTALNMILIGAEPSRLLALTTKKKIVMIEIGGGNTGYLTIMGGIACGVFENIYPEECHLSDLVLIKKRIRDVFQRQKNSTSIIFKNHVTFDSVSTESICRILCANTGIRFDYTVLGNFERGITPTAIDKINARLSAFKTIEVCLQGVQSGVVGICDSKAVFVSAEEALQNYDSEKDTVKNPSWLKYSKVCSSLE